MNTLIKLVPIVFVSIGLAACQHVAPNQAPPLTADPTPPSLRSQNASTNQATVARSTPQQQTQANTTTVITLHLAQKKQEPSLVKVDMGGSAPMYALPRPVLTQADIARISPVNTSTGSFLLLEMNVQGIPKLESITQQARGNYLLLSVQGNLVSVAQIGQIIKDGRLLVPTQSPQHTQAIIRLMQGRR